MTHEGIVEKFRECYSELYNSADTSKEMMNIKEKVNQIIDHNRELSYSEVRKITPSVVKDAVKMMKPQKTDVSGCYSSDVS